MATVAESAPPIGGRDEGFFLGGAIAMAVVLIAGFSLQLAMGRSSFAAPPLVHAHAVVFMGWIGIYVLQNAFVATGRMALHRRLGWLATGWVVAMLVLGWLVTVAMVQRGQVPFFFRPLQFLVFDPMTLITFAGLTAAAILLRRRTDWHRRLHFSAMALLLGPGFGRLLPMPLLIPWAWEATLAVSLIFPLAGIVWDLRRSGRVHPAWGWGLAAMAGCLVLTEAITYSPVGAALYEAVTAGSPGASVAPLDFPPPPAGPPPA
ncbi:MAG: hypothetical protein A2790_16575 [Phenylobacterium sp. RIFCSPHIGHO2_01_FULL_69_31]|uniref:hypothetical protein n=1 Tax=Phenylobacterium sp. RIFCSPHIGHO2_01_FULL_69_31 TaxID=1801944 RepID=UPI0008D509A5|nr:hypothetical protein [Phenylobacterium sp. RIFCSPHIGHO2_01_FULL_69_31]OHB27641.1 MAG: hypothetical protein A2790_16575 [Phenylobacterium sp. RIFCSPHIGHO2_01_FULL_69_31]